MDEIEAEVINQQLNQDVEATNNLRAGYNYDNEWIQFLALLAENGSAQDIVDFIEITEWTDRQKLKLMAFARIALGRGLSTTYITGITDYKRIYDDFSLAEAKLTIGMTKFDITPEFLEIIQLIRLHFGLEIRRSKGAHFIERLGTQRTEFVSSGPKAIEGFKNKSWSNFME